MKRTPEQEAAVTRTGLNLCVDAGAGSGKTRVLVERILHLLEHGGVPLERIVAITFTEKAAAEMKARVRRACHTRAPLDDAQAMTFWRNLERQVESARISTIHSFCMGLARENALLLNRDPDFSVLDEADSHLMIRETIEDTVHGLLEKGDPEAMALAAEYRTGRLNAMLAELINQRPVMERVLEAYPFDDAESLREAWEATVEEALAARRRAITQGEDFRAAVGRLRALEGACSNASDKREILRRGLLAALEDLQNAESLDAACGAARAIGELNAKGGSVKNWETEDAFRAAKDILDRARDWAKAVIPEEPDEAVIARSAELTRAMASVYRRVQSAVQEAKANRNAHDFDDLIMDAVALLRGHPEIRRRTARGIRHLLIDEFQDTDARQLELAYLLANEPDGPELFFVGDAKQSIYYFRGAEVEVFRKALDDAGETIPLAVNFRTVPDVMNWTNDFFARSGLLEAVEPEYRPLEARRPATGQPCVEYLLPELPEEVNAEEGRRIEAAAIADYLAETVGGPAPAVVTDPESGEDRTIMWRDCAMLFRSMSNLHLYEQALRERGVPYTVVAGRGFHQRQEVRDLRNLLSVVADPWDEMALLAFLRGPVGRLTDASLVQMAGAGGIAAVFHGDAAPPSFAQAEELQISRNIIRVLRDESERPMPGFVERVLELTGFEAIALSHFLGAQKFGNLRKLVDQVHGFNAARPSRLRGLIRYLDEVADETIREGEAAMPDIHGNMVTLMTIHKAKGLEFPLVILPDTAQKRQGSRGSNVALHKDLGMALTVTGENGETAKPPMTGVIRDAHKASETAESARLLYVALTRARDRLVLAAASTDKKDETSWRAQINAVYGLSDRDDGAVITGAGWALRVRRSFEGAGLTSPQRPTAEPPDRGALDVRMAPVSAVSQEQRCYSVSQLAAVMANKTPADWGGAFEGEPGRLTPMERGSLVHQLFEIWDFRAPVEPVIHGLLEQHHPASAHFEALAGDLASVANAVARTDLGQRIAEESGFQREVPFLWTLDGAVITGIIDGLFPDGTIVDYKTGKFPDDMTGYENQVLLYAAGMRELRGLTPPEAWLAFVDAGRAYEVSVDDGRIDGVRAQAIEALRRLRSAPADSRLEDELEA